MNNSSELKIGSILSYLQMILSIVIGLVYSPIMIRLLGQSEFGLYNTVASTISLLSILNLGFSASYIRYYSKYRVLEDTVGVFRLNGLFLIVFSVIGVISLVCGLFLSFNLKYVFSDGFSPNEYETAKLLMLLLTLNLAVSFPMSVFSTIISAHEKFVFLKLLGMIKTVLSPFVNIPLLLMGFGSVGLVIASLVLALITDILYFIYVRFKLHNRFYFKHFDHDLFKSLFAFTFFIALNMIVDQINNNVDKVLLGRFVGTSAVAIYAVGLSLHSYYTTISLSISGVFTPRIYLIYNKYIDNRTTRLRELSNLFIKVGRLQFLILMLFNSGIIFFGKSFISFWVGDGYIESYYVAVLLNIPSTITLSQNMGIQIQRAENKHQFRSIIYAIMAIFNLIITIYLCQIWGVIGAVMGTFLSILIANILLMNIYYAKGIGLDIKRYWYDISRIFIGMLPVLTIGLYIMVFVNMTSIWKMLFFILLYTTLYIINIWLFSMNQFEKNLFINPLKKLIGKRLKGNG